MPSTRAAISPRRRWVLAAIGVAVLLDGVDGDDVRVIQRGKRARLTPKAFDPLGIGCQFRREHFERDVPTETRVGGPIDRPHSAAADQRPNGVATDPGPGLHWDRDLTADELAASLTRVMDGVAVSATTR